MNRVLWIGIAAALTLESTVLAHGGGGGMAGVGGLTAGSGGGRGGGSAGRASATTAGGSSGASIGPTTQTRGSAAPAATGRGNVSRATSSVALGGRSVANTNHTFDRSAGRVPDAVCHSWDRGHEHLWNNRRCRFYDGVWYAYDGDYPNDYGSENPNASEVVDNPDAAPAPAPVAPVESAPVVSSPYATVQDVQDALANAGYYHGEIDGNLSPQLRYAVTAFQRDHHLSATGSLDGVTLSALAMK